MSDGPVYLTKESLRKLEMELKQLKTEERREISAEIGRARELGDLSENAEYHAAKEKQVHVERKIAEVQSRLSRVRIVDTDQIRTDKAFLMARVTVKDLDSGEKIVYTLSSPDDADIMNDVVSIDSPIGAGLLGKEVGDTIEIQAPAGTIRYELIKISVK